MAEDNSARQERIDRRVRIMTAKLGAIATMQGVCDQLDEMVPKLVVYLQEKERIGEFDANAGAILESLRVLAKIADHVRVLSQAMIDVSVSD